jgi:hypothetical protein
MLSRVGWVMIRSIERSRAARGPEGGRASDLSARLETPVPDSDNEEAKRDGHDGFRPARVGLNVGMSLLVRGHQWVASAPTVVLPLWCGRPMPYTEPVFQTDGAFRPTIERIAGSLAVGHLAAYLITGNRLAADQGHGSWLRDPHRRDRPLPVLGGVAGPARWLVFAVIDPMGAPVRVGLAGRSGLVPPRSSGPVRPTAGSFTMRSVWRSESARRNTATTLSLWRSGCFACQPPLGLDPSIVLQQPQ